MASLSGHSDPVLGLLRHLCSNAEFVVGTTPRPASGHRQLKSPAPSEQAFAFRKVRHTIMQDLSDDEGAELVAQKPFNLVLGACSTLEMADDDESISGPTQRRSGCLPVCDCRSHTIMSSSVWGSCRRDHAVLSSQRSHKREYSHCEVPSESRIA